MRPLMGGQVVGPGEYLAANSTGVWFDTRVQPHVPGQHIGTGKASPAHVAKVGLGSAAVRGPRFVPRGHVFGQTIVKRKHLSANGADVGHVRVGGGATASGGLDDVQSIE